MGLNKFILVIGVVLSFMSLTYSISQYLGMQGVESLIKEENYGDDLVLEKLKQIDMAKHSEAEIFLSEIDSRGEQLSSLRRGMRKTVSSSRWFAGVEIGLWLIAASLFSILLIREKFKESSRGQSC